MVLENAKPYVVSIRSHGESFCSPKLELVFAFGVVCVFAAYANLVVEECDEFLKGLAVHDFVVSFLLFMISLRNLSPVPKSSHPHCIGTPP